MGTFKQLLTIAFCLVGADHLAAEPVNLAPEPPPAPFAEREAPYSMVYYYLSADEDYTRWALTSLRDLGCTRAHALIYWWQHETLGNDDYWRQMGYNADHIGEVYLKKLDNFVNISHELGLRPSFRLGEKHKGELWHPADPSGAVEPYVDWVARVAERYRGKVDHYLLGDEMNKGHYGFEGKAERYINEFVIPMSKAIRAADANAKISATSVSSAPATPWQMDLLRAGLADYADGVAGNIDSRHTELRTELEAFMDLMRREWPGVKFFSNGVGYVEKFPPGQEALRAATLAQSMFTYFDLGWDSAPYYLYRHSMTADTKQDFGIISFPTADQPAVYDAAWYAFQTIAQTFYDRDKLKAPSFRIDLAPAEIVGKAKDTAYTLAPPGVMRRAYIRDDGQLLLYLTYPVVPHQQHGRWHVVLHSDQWGGPQRIPLGDYQTRLDMPHRYESDRIVIEDVTISEAPTIISLRRRIN